MRGGDSDIARIELNLAEAETYLARIPSTQVGAGELRERLAVYRRTLIEWLTTPPTKNQVRTLLERATEARRLAVMTAPTLSLHGRK